MPRFKTWLSNAAATATIARETGGAEEQDEEEEHPSDMSEQPPVSPQSPFVSRLPKLVNTAQRTNQSVPLPQSPLSTSTAAATAAVQQVHIISSSDDEADEKMEVVPNVLSDSAGSGFAGFPSPGATLQTIVTPTTSKHSLKRRSQQSAGDESAASNTRADNATEFPNSLRYRGGVAVPNTQVTPVKRKKEESTAKEQKKTDTLSADADTPPIEMPADQIVEINSNSTTNSQKQKRLQRNSKLQLKLQLNQQQQQLLHQHNNKCSSESTSEFPVSSPSNPQAGGGGTGGGAGVKYPQRTPLLKNTLPADSFERHLAVITARNPQMTLDEKMRAWRCDTELSDVEDVNNFDELFRKREESKRKALKLKKDRKDAPKEPPPTTLSPVASGADTEYSYDFSQFRAMIKENLNAQIRKEMANAAAPPQDKPCTSAAAHLAAQRRLKAAAEAETLRKRQQKDASGVAKKPQNSTTPPATSSSSENDVECYPPGPKKKALVTQKKLAAAAGATAPLPQKILVYEQVLCPSSSEEASQDAANANKAKQTAKPAADGDKKQQQIQMDTGDAGGALISPQMKLHWTTDEDSVFRLNRLNREIDKHTSSMSPSPSSSPVKRKGLIEMRLDFVNENKDVFLQEKKSELFKTPTVPQKYLQTPGHKSCSNANKASPTPSVDSDDGAGCAEQHASPDNAAQLGAFHQQHEFCNYLGLTGMSTANAVANAVAELAKCNLARRSLRVRRLQQQEKKQNGGSGVVSKSEKALEALKKKQLREVQRRQTGGKEDEEFEVAAAALSDINLLANEIDGEYKPMKFKNNTTSPTRYHHSPSPTKEPEIKILCHITANNKEQVEKVSASYIKQITAPIRQTLLRHLKRNGATNIAPALSNDTSTCPRSSSRSEEADVTADITGNNAHDMETRSNPLPKRELEYSPTQAEHTTRSQTRLIKCEALSHSTQSIQSVKSETHATKLNEEPPLMVEVNEDEPNQDPVHLQTMREKFQKYLEASRQTKPSIFIVQALDSKENKAASEGTAVAALATTKHNNTAALDEEVVVLKQVSVEQLTANDSKAQIKKRQVIGGKHSRKLQQRLSSVASRARKNKNNQIHRLLTRSNYSMSQPQRQLRSRKIVILKRMPKPPTATMQTQTREKSTPKAAGKVTPLCNVSPPNATVAQQLPLQKQSPLPRIHRTAAQQQKQCKSPEVQPAEIIFRHPRTAFKKSKPEQLPSTTTNLQKSPKRKLNVHNIPTATRGRKLEKSPAVQRLFRKPTTLESSPQKAAMRKTTNITNTLKPNNVHVANATTDLKLSPAIALEITNLQQQHQDNDAVVVSSTTKEEEEELQPNSLVPASAEHDDTNSSINPNRSIAKEISKDASFVVIASTTPTKDSATQSCCKAPKKSGIHYLTTPSSALLNPIKSEHGAVLYIFYELDVLIVVQELLVSFWKYSKLLNVLLLPPPTRTNMSKQQSTVHARPHSREPEITCAAAGGNSTREPAGEWVHLAECKRLINDIEISTPYPNRICVHNSMPIYVEMRCRDLPHERRDCNLLSMYINVYYYHDEEMNAKMHSIQLDTVQSIPSNVIYTSITESRYFVMSWPQENILGKIRSGLCKYSLTPHLDTLASIREFKSMRHEIRYLECTDDDKLLGFGATQLTIWDHRSGDVLMNYDLDIQLGQNLGSIYYPSLEIGQNNMILLFQYIQKTAAAIDTVTEQSHESGLIPEMHVIACSISHSAPTHRLLMQHKLPMPAFNTIASAVNTGEHLLIRAQNDEELWISCDDPNMMSCVPPQQTQRFYARGRTHLIELTASTLMVDSFANHILKLAAEKINTM